MRVSEPLAEMAGRLASELEVAPDRGVLSVAGWFCHGRRRAENARLGVGEGLIGDDRADLRQAVERRRAFAVAAEAGERL